MQVKELRRAGEVFREIRKSKNILVKDAAKGVCSPGFLSKFERGLYDISSDTLFALLKSNDISFEDFELAIYSYQSNQKETFFQKIYSCFKKKDVSTLKIMLINFREHSYKQSERDLYILMISAAIHELEPQFPLPSKDIKNASDFLISIEQWGYYELAVFSNVAYLLNMELSSTLTKELICQKEKFCISRKIKQCFIRMLINVSLPCIQQDYLKEASLFLTTIEKLISEEYPFNVIGERLVFAYIQGYYELICGRKRGIQLMKQAVQDLKVTRDKEIIQQYQDYFREGMEHARRKFGDYECFNEEIETCKGGNGYH